MKRVEYDINKSEYFYKVLNLKFYFTSIFNKERFENNYNYFIEEETNKLQAKYHVKLNIDEILLIAFYKKIEKRGFKVLVYYNEGKIVELDENYVFNLR